MEAVITTADTGSKIPSVIPESETTPFKIKSTNSEHFMGHVNVIDVVRVGDETKD